MVVSRNSLSIVSLRQAQPAPSHLLDGQQMGPQRGRRAAFLLVQPTCNRSPTIAHQCRVR